MFPAEVKWQEHLPNPSEMHSSITIVGAGGFGREVATLLPGLGLHLAGFLDDQKHGDSILGLVKQAEKESSLLLGLGDSVMRKKLYEVLGPTFHYPTIVDGSVLFLDPATIHVGEGTILCPGSIFTCNIQLGRFNVVNLKCTIGHDCTLGDFVSLMPAVNLGGGVHLEEGVYIGTNATILPGVKVGAWSVIGAGAVVTRDVPPHETWVGVPAKRIEK
jgi:sugar O-acyltransferase (sialic acid O-acetyltransferase NeuD family)